MKPGDLILCIEGVCMSMMHPDLVNNCIYSVYATELYDDRVVVVIKEIFYNGVPTRFWSTNFISLRKILSESEYDVVLKWFNSK